MENSSKMLDIFISYTRIPPLINLTYPIKQFSLVIQLFDSDIFALSKLNWQS